MTTEAPTRTPLLEVDDTVVERALCEQSFRDYLDLVRILEPPPGRGVISWQPWPHLVELARTISAEVWDDRTGRNLALNRLISIGKARQLGVTWLLAAYAGWKAEFFPGAVIFLFSQGETEAGVFLGKCRFIHEHMPDHLKSRILKDSNEHRIFANGSKIVAWPSTEKAGRSETASLVIQDEADNHEHLSENYMAVKPTIDGGGQLIQVSTINKRKPRSLFRQIYKGAPGNNFKRVFYGVFARADRDEQWYEDRYAEARTQDLKGMSPELYMEQEYPRTEAEMLALSRTLAAFDIDALKDMLQDCRSPVETDGPIEIFQKPVVGKKYAAGSDPSGGTGGDSSPTVVLDAGTGMVVAHIYSNTMATDTQAAESVRMLKMYGYPLWVIEDNDWGRMVLRKAEELEYPNLYERKKDTPGWHTMPSNRYEVWGELIVAVRNRELVIPSERGLLEFFSVIINEDKNSRVEALEGEHDDYPMAVALAWQMRKEVSLYTDTTPVHAFKRESDARGNLPPPAQPAQGGFRSG